MPVPDPSHDAEARLLARYAAGDLDAARALVAVHLPRLLGFAQRLLGDRAEAEDVAQEALLRLWRAAPGWQPGRARVSTWLYRVATNLCVDQMRARRRLRPLQDAAEAVDPAPAADGRLIAADRAAALRAAIATLPPRQAQAVVLRHLEGLANPQIAEIMDSGVEAVESLISRGRRGLQAALAPHRDRLGSDDDRS